MKLIEKHIIKGVKKYKKNGDEIRGSKLIRSKFSGDKSLILDYLDEAIEFFEQNNFKRVDQQDRNINSVSYTHKIDNEYVAVKFTILSKNRYIHSYLDVYFKEDASRNLSFNEIAYHKNISDTTKINKITKYESQMKSRNKVFDIFNI